MRVQQLKKILRLATDILPKLPERGDPLLTVLVKLLGIADSIDQKAIDKAEGGLLKFFAGIPNVERVTNKCFVDLFFGTGMSAGFRLTATELSDWMDVVQAHHPKLGDLYFVEHRYGSKPEYGRTFWHGKSFDFAAALTLLWGEHRGGLHLDLTRDADGNTVTGCYGIPPLMDPILGTAARERWLGLSARQVQYRHEHIPRTYLFLGEPGTGKSTMALRFANDVGGGRVLRIDAPVLTSLGALDLDLVVGGLEPDVIVVDDIDRAPELEQSLATLFTVLTDFKARHPEVVVILTANDAGKLDAALLRPGRIDEIEEFLPPDAAERGALLRGYLIGFQERGPAPPRDAHDVAELVAASEGLTAAYLREIALQASYRPLPEVLAFVKRRRALALRGKEEGAKGEATPAAAAPKAN